MTIKFNKFELHSAFQFGQLSEQYFVDLPNLKPDQLTALSIFLGKITREEPLPGKNKPSWLRDEETKIPDTDAYEDGNYWHYHCGPYGDSVQVRSMTFNLGFNARGLTSKEVIHYQKLDDGTVLVVGFSPEHDPFPRSDDPHHNPLFSSD
ncbi:hypothetical protein [Serratia liquefaciens]|uniref:hypothetical protein n=1 Tax=Serratia liquefaciens TaxID=614 RepID=UPI0021C836BB|nr:hypothetical protein [Serratia liquefaciens]